MRMIDMLVDTGCCPLKTDYLGLRFYDILSAMRYHKGFGDGYDRGYEEAYEQGCSDANVEEC